MHVAPVRANNPFIANNPPARPRDDVIHRIALQTLTELTLSLTIGIAVSFFVAPAAVASIFIYIAIQTVVNLTLRCLQSQFAWTQGIVFSQLAGNDGQTLIHEGGHACCSYLVYKNPDPTISINPLNGGSTSFFPNRLTRFGKWLGHDGSRALVTAAGPALTLFVSSIILAIGLKLRRTKPEISAYCLAYATSDFITHAHYAISALWTSSDKAGHDFVRLAALTRISPILMAMGIIAVPILITAICEAR